MKKAIVKSVDHDKDLNIIVTISAKGTSYFSNYAWPSQPMLLNASPLTEGINLVLEYGHIAVEKFKDNKDFSALIAENESLKKRLNLLCLFESGERVKHKGKVYQKGVNEGTFHKDINI